MDRVMTPYGAFITFEHEEGVEMALKYNELTKEGAEHEKLGKWMQSEEIEVERAPEPDDIIWENTHVPRR